MRPATFALLTLITAGSPGAGRLDAAWGQAPAAPKLAFPLACTIGRNCEVQHYVDRDPGPGVLDYRCAHRTYQAHDGIDIRLTDMGVQRAGVDVLAAAAGRVVAIRDDVQDISIRAPGAPSVAGRECGNRVAVGLGGGWITDYCHLAKGSLKVKVGETVAVGQPLARVGLSGDTEFPHLHFSVRRGASVVDPFAPDMTAPTTCGAQTPLWTPEAQRGLAYKAGAVLNVGFAGGAISMEAVEAGALPPVSATAPLEAYARVIGLAAGDRVELALSGPGGRTIAQGASSPMVRDRDQELTFAGARAPAGGWPHGLYSAEVRVRRAGAVAISQRFQTTL
jgi:hypothetical protein